MSCTNKTQFEAIKKTIEVIDKDVKSALDLELLAKKVGISQYHLHRLFKSITGKSVMSYVRGRKLGSSIVELINTDLKIIDIASEYQFDYEQSYIRAFKRQYNLTPSQYRKMKCELPIEQKIDTSFLLNLGQGLLIKPRMCFKPSFHVQGLKQEIVHSHNLTNQDTNKLALKVKELLPLIKNAVSKDICFGVVLYGKDPSYSNDYIIGIEVDSGKRVDPPFFCYTLPSSEYAVFRYIGFHSPYDVTYATLLELYDYIDTWRDKSSYQQAYGYHFEKMNYNTHDESYCEMDIYIPIITKQIT